MWYKGAMENKDKNINNSVSGTENTEPKSSYTGTQRLIARIGLLLIAALILLLIALLIIGAEPGAILSVLFLLIVVPCAIYGIKLYIGFLKK